MAAALPADSRKPASLHPLALTCALVVLWLLPGLVGHDPWKPDEAYVIGLIQHIYASGDWIVPRALGEPVLQQPPLYALTAAAFGWLFGPLLPLHDAARLASGFYLIITFLALHAAARELWRNDQAWLAVLALLSALGLAPPAHTLFADLAQLAGLSLAVYGFALHARRPLAAGLWLGTGAGVAFLAKGLLGPVALALTAAALPAAGAQWRGRSYAATCASALVAAAPWLMVWPFLLWSKSPALFAEWWASGSGMEKVSGGSVVQLPMQAGYYLVVLLWFAFPVLPLAAWGIWSNRASVRARGDLIMPAALFIALLLLIALGAGHREVYALPLLIPLALLAPQGALDLRRGAANALWWFSALFGSFALLMMWFEYSALELGFPMARHRHWLRLQPAYVSGIGWWTLAMSTAITAFWAVLLLRSSRLPARGLVAWSAGLCVVWAVALTMFLRYVDLGKSYRSVAMHITRHVPADAGCVASRDLGQPQRILLHYFTGIQTVRIGDAEAAHDCRALIVQGQRTKMAEPGARWTLVWEGARPGDRKELLRLYRKR